MPRARKPEQSAAGSFRYSERDAENILRALRRAGLPEDADGANLIEAVTALARSALLADAGPVPTAKQIRTEMDRLARAAAQLAAGLDTLSLEARAFLQGHLDAAETPPVAALTIHRLRALMLQVGRIAHDAASALTWRHKARPRTRRPCHICPRQSASWSAGRNGGRRGAVHSSAMDGPRRRPLTASPSLCARSISRRRGASLAASMIPSGENLGDRSAPSPWPPSSQPACCRRPRPWMGDPWPGP